MFLSIVCICGAGSFAVCWRTRAACHAVCVCAGGCGVHAGEESDHTRPYGSAALPAPAGWSPAQASVF